MAEEPGSMVKSMGNKKITVTIPEELLAEIRPEVAERGMSAYVTEAIRAKHERAQLVELVDWLEDEYGPVTDERLAAARMEMAEIDAEHERRRKKAAGEAA